LAGHAARLKIDHKQRLPTFDLTFRVSALPPHPGQYRSFVIAEIHRQLYKFVGFRHVFDPLDGANPDVELVDIACRDLRLYRGR
jgi:hypothetical protein